MMQVIIILHHVTVAINIICTPTSNRVLMLSAILHLLLLIQCHE